MKKVLINIYYKLFKKKNLKKNLTYKKENEELYIKENNEINNKKNG